jgi:Transposase DNA-binding/Transposase Tn5 dimerisation domain
MKKEKRNNMAKILGKQPIKEEFVRVELGDQRLSHRLVHLVDLLENEFESSLPKACSEWKEIKAAYRFFSNDHIDPEQLQNTHILNTVARINDVLEDSVILVQDSTSLNYHSHPATLGLGDIANSSGKRCSEGIQCHSGMIYTVHGTPLGLTFQKFWLRKNKEGEERIKYRRGKYRIPFEKKESFRWLEGIRVAHLLQQQVKKHIIVVQDREGAINQVIEAALNFKIGFICRVKNQRTCIESGHQTIRNYLKSRNFDTKIEIEVVFRKKYGKSKKDNRRYPPQRRRALIEVWWQEIAIRMKINSKSPKSARMITVLLAEEKIESNQRVKEPLSWILFTNESIKCNKDALKILAYYKCRWQIEEYHRIWKSGCRVEDCRLGSAQKLIRYLKVMAVIAWRQHYLTEIGREFPNFPASICLSSSEIQAVNLQAHNDLDTTLTLRQAWHLISRIGGFMDRKSDNDPGPTTFWRGLQKIVYIAKGIDAAFLIIQQKTDRQSKAA